MAHNRDPRGIPTGGRFAAGRRPEAEVGLDDPDEGSADPAADGDAICSGTTQDGSACLNFVAQMGDVCGLCAGIATDRFGNVLGRGAFPRDGRGSALVTSPTGELYKSGKKKGTIKLLPYKSASSVTVQVSEEALSVWKQQQLLRALARDRDLADRFHKAMDEVDPDDDEAEAEVLKAFRKEAHEIAETQLAAQKGSFAHWLTECADNGQSPINGLDKGAALGIDAETADQVMDQWAEVNDRFGFEPLAVEAKIVNDELRAAGTTDRVVRLRQDLAFTHDGEPVTIPAGTRLITDLKTGKLRTDAKGNPNFWQKYAGQLAVYAGGELYDPKEGERKGWDAVGGRPSQEWGVIIHGDLEKMAAGRDDSFSVFMVDLRPGKRLAEVSNELRTAEKIANKAFSPAA